MRPVPFPLYRRILPQAPALSGNACGLVGCWGWRFPAFEQCQHWVPALLPQRATWIHLSKGIPFLTQTGFLLGLEPRILPGLGKCAILYDWTTTSQVLLVPSKVRVIPVQVSSYLSYRRASDILIEDLLYLGQFFSRPVFSLLKGSCNPGACQTETASCPSRESCHVLCSCPVISIYYLLMDAFSLFSLLGNF